MAAVDDQTQENYSASTPTPAPAPEPVRIKLFGTTISPTAESKQATDGSEEASNAAAEKRLDKVIPCPRCRSTETKFCYFNNYNVNQPRHFCKGCQRYWTAGGALRNVPVGAGRRKSKPTDQPREGGCLFDAAGRATVRQLDFDGDAATADHDAFRHLFPGKRRRFGSSSQTC